jgi:hypothetical protein
VTVAASVAGARRLGAASHVALGARRDSARCSPALARSGACGASLRVVLILEGAESRPRCRLRAWPMARKRTAWWQRTTPGQLTVSPFGGRLLCHVCGNGAAFHQLDVHVTRAHGMTPAVYCARFGLPAGSDLVSATSRARRAQAALDSPLHIKARRPDDVVLRLDDEDCCCT